MIILFLNLKVALTAIPILSIICFDFHVGGIYAPVSTHSPHHAHNYTIKYTDNDFFRSLERSKMIP
jgi:hypothetical protein